MFGSMNIFTHRKPAENEEAIIEIMSTTNFNYDFVMTFMSITRSVESPSPCDYKRRCS